MAAGVCVRPDGSEAQLAFGFRPGSYNDEALMTFVLELREHLGGAKVTLIWDGLPSHRSRAMRSFLREHRRWFVVEPLPPYAYDLNPVEQVWGNLKGTELVNLCPDTIAEATTHVEHGLKRIAGETRLCLSFVRHCGLRL